MTQKAKEEVKAEKQVTQKSKKRKEVFPYGNYRNYYGYRIGRELEEDPRLKVLRNEWFEGKDCLDIGCNSGIITINIAKRFCCRNILGIDIDSSSVMSKNLVDAPLPSVEESITGPLLLDHEMDSTQGDPIEIDDDEEDTDEGIPDKKRKKKSQVWLEFKEIEVGDGTKKAECMHCKQRLKYAGTTSQLKRHLDNTCTRRKIALRSQRMLNVVPVAPGISKAIPITTVASESTFSAGGRVIDTYRASLSTDTVQALVCGGDWVRHKFGIKKKPRKRDNTLFEEEVVITIP